MISRHIFLSHALAVAWVLVWGLLFLKYPMQSDRALSSGTHADSDAIENGEIHRLYECGSRGLRTLLELVFRLIR